MKLINMTDFVLQQQSIEELNKGFSDRMMEKLGKIFRYAKFIKQPLKLEMFVPTDEEGNVLEDAYDTLGGRYFTTLSTKISKINDAYELAKQKVLFEGFEYSKEIINSGGNYTHILRSNEIEIYIQWGGYFVNGKHENKLINIEDLVKYNLMLTPLAIKQL